KWITFGGTFNFSYKVREEPVVGVTEAMQMTFKAQSYHPALLEDGNYGMNFFDVPGHRRYRNPLALTSEGDSDINNRKLFLKTFRPHTTMYEAKTKEPT